MMQIRPASFPFCRFVCVEFGVLWYQQQRSTSTFNGMRLLGLGTSFIEVVASGPIAAEHAEQYQVGENSLSQMLNVVML